jgi:hypothetical protein
MEPPFKRSRTRSQLYFLSVKAQTWCAARVRRGLQAAMRAWHAMLPDLHRERRQREDAIEDQIDRYLYPAVRSTCDFCSDGTCSVCSEDCPC